MCLCWRGSAGRIAGLVAFFSSGGGGILDLNSRAGMSVVLVAPIVSLMVWFWTRSSKVRVDLGALANRMEP